MELFDLESGLKSVASGGQVLSCQEIAGLQAGLALLKSKEQYHRIYFWGKVFGQTADYYVAYGLRDGDFEFPTKHFFFAGKDFQFNSLVSPTAEEADRIVLICGDKALTGNAGTQLEPPKEGEEEPPTEELEPGQERPQGPKKLTEADRLAKLVHDIDFDTAVVPKGTYALSEGHQVVASHDFKGLTLSAATALTNYVHYRAPVSIAALRTLARIDAQAHADNILDCLDSDQPKGCWAIRKDPTADLVTLRSLSWPGYIAFHVSDTKKFGGIYFGYAQKSFDLPFLL